MKVLLDTHTFIWLLEGSENLSKKALDTIQSEHSVCFLSVASLWEMAIKVSISKLEIAVPFEEVNQMALANGIEILPITFEHTNIVAQLPFHHKDPFDRIIIAQGFVENMTIISADNNFELYTRNILW